MTERTPDILALPWTEGIVGNPRIYATDGLGPLSGLVAEVAACGDPLVRRERLRFIVKAVNNHDKLVEALGKALKFMGDFNQGFMTSDDWDAQEEANALLASLNDKEQTP